MTLLEELRKRIEQLYNDSNVSTYDDEWVQGYEHGKEIAYGNCLDMLDEYMEASDGNH